MYATGTILDERYTIEAVLGQGGMGSVYLAHSLQFDMVAIKEMRPTGLAVDAMESAQRQFRHEASLLRQLSHPRLPRIIDYFEVDGTPHLVMDYIKGRTLAAIIAAEEEPLNEAMVKDWADQLCDVLEYLHHHTPVVVFRDLKPGNIIVDVGGQIRLIDFGISKLFDDRAPEITKTFARGCVSPGFTAPEQYGGGTDPRSDLYSLGATLWCVLTGTVPASAVERAADIHNLPSLRKLRPDISATFAAGIEKLMTVKVGDRPASVADARELLQLRPGPPLPPVRPPGVTSRTSFSPTLMPPTVLVPGASPPTLSSPVVSPYWADDPRRKAPPTAPLPAPSPPPPTPTAPVTALTSEHTQTITMKPARRTTDELPRPPGETSNRTLQSGPPPPAPPRQRRWSVWGASAAVGVVLVAGGLSWAWWSVPRDNTAQTAPVEAAPPSHSLRIVTTPAGADVELNGESGGITPLTLQFLPRGSYHLTLHKDGYEPSDEVVKLEDPENRTLQQTLVRLHHMVRLTVTPGGTQITLDGHPQGVVRGGATQLAIEVGPHVLAFSRPGYVTQSRTVTVDPDQPIVSLEVALTASSHPVAPHAPTPEARRTVIVLPCAPPMVPSSGAAPPSSPLPADTSAEDFLIIPGNRVGPFTLASPIDPLLSRYSHRDVPGPDGTQVHEFFQGALWVQTRDGVIETLYVTTPPSANGPHFETAGEITVGSSADEVQARAKVRRIGRQGGDILKCPGGWFLLDRRDQVATVIVASSQGRPLRHFMATLRELRRGASNRKGRPRGSH